MPPTLKQIAQRVGVSHQAVSCALNGRVGQVSEKTRDRIVKAAHDMGYRPNTAARSIRSHRTRQVGLLVPNSPGNRFAHPLAYETILGINEGLQAAGYIAVLSRIEDVKADLAQQSRVFKEHALDGMIVLDSMPRDIEQRLERLFPDTIWCDSNVWRDVWCLRRDEREAGRLAAQAVIDHGYRQVRIMSYDKSQRDHFSSRQRCEGASQTLRAAGIESEIISEPGINHLAERKQLAAGLTPDTAVICDSIYHANVLRSLSEEHGKLPGRDFGMVSCDDMHQLDRLWPGLTRVSFDRYDMGLQAAAMMLDRLGKHRRPIDSRLLPPHLVSGSTLHTH